MEQQVEKIKQTALSEIKNVNDLHDLEEIKVKYLGKKGELTAILKTMGTLPAEER